MRLPIALGLTWPERLEGVEKPLTWTAASQWTFEPVDNETFPAVDLARFAVGESATHPAVLNAANEVLVDAFIAGRSRGLRLLTPCRRSCMSTWALLIPRWMTL